MTYQKNNLLFEPRVIKKGDPQNKIIKSKNNIGKKLDFYTQEMLREANTMSSKALISEIKNEAVDIKSSIERMKEHAQNIE